MMEIAVSCSLLDAVNVPDVPGRTRVTCSGRLERQEIISKNTERVDVDRYLRVDGLMMKERQRACVSVYTVDWQLAECGWLPCSRDANCQGFELRGGR